MFMHIILSSQKIWKKIQFKPLPAGNPKAAAPEIFTTDTFFKKNHSFSISHDTTAVSTLNHFD